MTILELNALPCEQFTEALGWVFEHSPWVAERAWPARPFADLDALHKAMVSRVESAPLEERLALLRAHPDLGTKARMSVVSTGEQQRAGLAALSPDELERLEKLNTQYRERFGFPFIFAVKGAVKGQILSALEERLSSSQDQEFAEALRQVHRIARFRLEETVMS
jgi:2-oxo-4-hydroxy-4-carboxy-5-ureidoimidazoline decarboxylase